MAEKFYETYGIPENYFPEYDLPPEHAKVILLDESDKSFPNNKLSPHSIRLWGKATYWTALEASLLLAGIDPNDDELYAVSSEEVVDDNFNSSFNYTFKYNYEFCNARDYLFLFERSALAPKSSPLEWVKYFNLTVRNAKIDNPFEPAYCEEWQKFFRLELENTETQKEIESIGDLGRRVQQHEIMLAIIAALEFDPLNIPDKGKSKIKAACLTRPRFFTVSSFDHAWKDGLNKSLFRMANHEKYSQK